MEAKNLNIDCSRGCITERKPNGELVCQYTPSCCKREIHNWLDGITQAEYKNYFEIRFKNTRKAIFVNDSGQLIREGDFVVVEAATGYDVGIVTIEGALISRQMLRNRIDKENYEFRKIYRKAKPLDMERWQEAIAREHHVMIRSRQIAEDMNLNMKIGDVEFQGDGTKAIFYYIADERVDFRQLIKIFAEEFRIRIEMKQIGARQEAGLIGGIGVCGRALCCSSFMSDFHSISTQTARSQDLSLNPLKLAGQCSKLKCCINHEAATYIDAQEKLPRVDRPLELKDGFAFFCKTDLLKGILWFSYEEHGQANMIPLTITEVKDIQQKNRQGIKPDTLFKESDSQKSSDFIDAVGDDNIDRFNEAKRKKKRKKPSKKRAPNDKQA